MEIPVYLFTGFLESGKTTMIQETLLDPEFSDGEKTLLLCLEEGELDYDPEFLKQTNTTLIQIDNQEMVTEEYYESLQKQFNPDRILIEFNGMWSVSEFLDKPMPMDWILVQIVSTVDAQTFMLYVNNMRSLLYEQLVHSEMIVINRCDGSTKKSFLRSNIKAINKAAQLIYESIDGSINDLPEDDLPFDIEADVIEVSVDDYGLWYMDALDHPEKYDGKQVTFKGKIVHLERNRKSFVIGRYAMVCCADDTALIGFLCHCSEPTPFILEDWIVLKSKIQMGVDEESGRKILVLHQIEAQISEELPNDMVSFS